MDEITSPYRRRQLISGTSQKVLAQELRELEVEAMIDRERTGKPPAPVMCWLTGYGYSMVRNEEHP